MEFEIFYRQKDSDDVEIDTERILNDLEVN